MKTEPERDGESRWEELVLAESCGEITDVDRVELERLAERNDARRYELELLTAIGSLVPVAPELPAQDRQLIQSVLAQHRKRARRRRTGTRAIGVAVALLPFAAAAGYWADATGGSESASKAARTLPAPPTTGRALPSARAASKEAGADVETLNAAATAAPLAPVASTPPSAAELLSRAQDARSVRNYAGAVKLYRELARTYPKSAEAHLSRISLAQLELTQGNPQQALAGFEAYERLGGPLLQEAEYGKIQALGALGRTDEERAEIRRFLARHPKSLQAAALKRRLGVEGATE
jgi:tetratricopeptide (TPR) repeat protein